MKKLLLFISILFGVTIFCRAQTKDELLWITTFEDDWTFIEFDPSENNIWQVGIPSKTILDSAYSAPFALMTDTSKMLTELIKHSFILKAERPWWSNAIFNWNFGFYQKCNFDSLYSGGYIELSYDKGETWINIVNPQPYQIANANVWRLYTKNDTLINGEPAMTGNYNWQQGLKSLGSASFKCTPESGGMVTNVWLKFTYINLKKNNLHEGWLIDNLVYAVNHWCEYFDIDVEGIKTSIETTAYPNPAAHLLTIEYQNTGNQELELRVYEINGKRVLTNKGLCGSKININITELPNGYYFYNITNQSTINYKGRFIIEK